MKRWSKLQREIQKLIAEDLDFQIHCTMYRMKSQRGSTNIPRYWITCQGEVIFDYPKNFRNTSVSEYYPYDTDISTISDLIREYIDTPKEELLTKEFPRDDWGLIDILRSADRRVGFRRLEEIQKTTQREEVRKVIRHRLKY